MQSLRNYPVKLSVSPVHLTWTNGKTPWKCARKSILKQKMCKSSVEDLTTSTIFNHYKLVYTTQVNSTFRTRWLASSEVISQVLFTSKQPKKKQLAFVGILSEIKLPFGPLVFQLVWYILKQLSISASVKLIDIYLRFGEQLLSIPGYVRIVLQMSIFFPLLDPMLKYYWTSNNAIRLVSLVLFLFS